MDSRKVLYRTLVHENSTVIGVVEAHALAILTAGALWYFAQKQDTTFGNWIGLLAHAVLGVSNLVWFDVFTRVHAGTQGVAVTVIHFVFVLLNAFVVVRHGGNQAKRPFPSRGNSDAREIF